MKILTNRETPTGNILIVQGDKGKLECLSVGDYGKEHNIKADFLNLSRELQGVPHKALQPLEDKWVITISTQYGCSMNCTFCDVPKVGSGKNATEKDLVAQVLTCIRLHPEVQETNRLNVHFARMGEPTFNPAVLSAAYELERLMKYLNFKFHPVVSTMMPYNTNLFSFLSSWLNFKNDVMNGEAGLQLSINTTDEQARAKMFNKNAMTLDEISNLFSNVNGPTLRYSLFNRYDDDLVYLKGRKIALNFALTDAPIDAQRLRKLFDPRVFLCKITPMHLTASCVENNLETKAGYEYYYPYKQVEQELKDAGFDVIVFVPSIEEDMSKITCGNAILAEKP